MPQNSPFLSKILRGFRRTKILRGFRRTKILRGFRRTKILRGFRRNINPAHLNSTRAHRG